MRRIRYFFSACICFLAAVMLCGSAAADTPQIDGLTFLEEVPLTYAKSFQLFRYKDGYTLISVPGSGEYLIVPEDGSIPKNVPEGTVVLQKPINRIYLAATSAMSLFDAVDAVDAIRMTGTQASGWYIDSAVEALNSGRMLFAGKYSEPDYETLLLEDCQIAIESTMIFHTPKVKEMIEDLAIPVLVDHSSYETHPLGRTEWIKLYAVLTGKEKEANAFFEQQANVIRQLQDQPRSKKKVAFFYVNSDGSIVVRNPRDYIPQMVELGGGNYLCPDLLDAQSTTVPVTMESFYAIAWDADYLIYSGSIEGALDNVRQLIDKDALFADFRAVQEGNVWCTGKSFYQSTDIVGQMIADIYNMLNSGDEGSMTFLRHVGE